jgi:anthranilate phosphoribosyltransferase
VTGFNAILNDLRHGQTLDEDTMIAAMRLVMEGLLTETDLAVFLTLLSQRGETVDELTGAARVIREMAATISAPPGAVDCCGTGGDGLGTYNISTAAALIAASCGVPVAKHGNRASSSKSGTADVLEALGVNLDAPHARLEQALRELNFAFLMAPAHHQAMRHVASVRKKLGFRTIFNLLGPLANPANTDIQLIGVYAPRWLRPLAETLQRLGTHRAWIVHGRDGLDEITTAAQTDIVTLEQNRIGDLTLSPSDFGLPETPPEALKGGDVRTNADALLALLNGADTGYRTIALANAAAVLHLAGKVEDLPAGVHLAANAIDSGATKNLLRDYCALLGSRLI